MSRYENLLIDGPSSLEEAAGALAAVVGSAALARSEGVSLRWDADVSIDLFDDADYEDDFGMPLSQFRFVASVRAVSGVAAQVAVARELFRRLVADTGYRLLLALDDAQEYAAARPALTAA